MKRIHLVFAALMCLSMGMCFLPTLQADHNNRSRFVLVDRTPAVDNPQSGVAVSVFFDVVTERSYAVFNGNGTAVVEVQTVKPQRVHSRDDPVGHGDNGLGDLLDLFE